MEAAAAAHRLAARLQAVQSIKTDVLYMALNTSLKSVHMGEAGRPLSTIATELRAQSGTLAAAASMCTDVLAAMLIAATQARGEDNPGEIEVGDALVAAAARIKAAGEANDRDMVTLTTQGEAVRTMLTQNLQALEFQSQIGEHLHLVAHELGWLTTQAVCPTPELAPLLQTMLNQLHATFTMAQEREIYAAFCVQFNLPSPAAPPTATAEDEMEDALF
jgi:hypothetical protein